MKQEDKKIQRKIVLENLQQLETSNMTKQMKNERKTQTIRK
jgi:hypothetical protein